MKDSRIKSESYAGILGFTLIEIVIVIAISITILGGGTVALTGFLARERVLQSASELSSSLSLARNAAVVNRVPIGFANGLDYVAVTIDSTGTIKAYPVNNPLGIGTTYFSNPLLKGDVSVTTISLGGLQFGAGSGKLVSMNTSTYASSPLNSTDNVVITVSSPSTSTTKTITVSAFGITTN